MYRELPLVSYTRQMMCHSCMSKEFLLVDYTNIIIYNYIEKIHL
jgi:hypothetical protein